MCEKRLPPPNGITDPKKRLYHGDLEPLSRSLCPGTSFKRNQKVVLPFFLLPPQPAYFLVATSASWETPCSSWRPGPLHALGSAAGRGHTCPTRTLTRLLALAYAEEILNKYLYLLLSITIHLLVISKGKPHPGRFLKKNKKPKPVTRTKETKEAHRTRHFRQTCFLFVPSPRAPP